MTDYKYLNGTGVIVPDTSDILDTVKSEYTGVWPDLNVTSDGTAQSVLIESDALTRAEMVANNAALGNQINPNEAGGVFLDAICAMTGLEPPNGSYSLLRAVVVTGQPFTPLAAGTQARIGPNGAIFQTVTATTLDGDGNSAVDFQALEKGEIACGVGDLDTIVTEILGWETVSNPAVAELGEPELSDAALRALRQNTLALQGISLPEAITSALYDTPGVRSLSFRENIANTTQTIDGISMVAHSIWACVDGGLDLDVATAMLGAKSMGANWNGAVTVNVTEPASGQVYPVKFARPTTTAVFARVTIKTGTLTGDPVTQIRAAILAYAAGEISGMEGFKVGTDVSPFELAAAVVSQLPGVFVMKVEVSLDGSTWQTTELVFAIDHLATIASSAITVVEA